MSKLHDLLTDSGIITGCAPGAITRKRGPYRTQKPWTAEELERIAKLRLDGYSNTEIAATLGRTPGTIAGQLWRMRIPSPTPQPARRSSGLSPAEYAKAWARENPRKRKRTNTYKPRPPRPPSKEQAAIAKLRQLILYDERFCQRRPWDPSKDAKPEWLQRAHGR